MCGIAGFIDLKNNIAKEQFNPIITSMNDTMIHRGPNSSGTWIDTNNGIALGHRRLSIIDLSKLGHQPMISSSDRYILTYNGEIYNFQIIKNHLSEQNCKFKGTSDTEVLLTAIEKWGLEKTLTKINGMFAFALWDKKEKTLSLARDRIGKKPLYYGIVNNIFFFASELKAIKIHPSFISKIDKASLSLYLRHNYIPAPFSIYSGIKKLSSASYLTFSPHSGKNIKIRNYWNIKDIAEKGSTNPLDITYNEAINQLDKQINKAVSQRMISDVPLGSFLSGGIDSSLITAIMQKKSDIPIKTFCIGFEESKFNEAKHAKAIASYLGTDHTEFYVTSKETLNIIPKLPEIYDEPFADPSQIPTFLVSKLAKNYVTVALSGDGGDELFAGYSRYNLTKKISRIFSLCPLALRSSLAKILEKLHIHGRVAKFLELMDAKNEDDLYIKLMSYWKNPTDIVIDGYEPDYILNDRINKPNITSFTNKMMYFDMVSYLPDDILVKVDRASMAASLESRAPLLDYQLIEYAWKIPLNMKVKENKGKQILVSLLEQYIPKELFDKPKQGFGIPHSQWLRGPLREWAESLINEERLRKENIFNSHPIQQKWQEHLSGKYDWGYYLWSILMFQAWYDNQ